MFQMFYDNDYMPIEAKVCLEDDINLTQLFSYFIEMTRMMGYHEDSWANVIKEIYKYCVAHKDAAPNYSIYDYAMDNIIPIE